MTGATFRAAEQDEQSTKARRALDATFPDLRIEVEDQVLRRSAILGLRYVTGRLSSNGKRASRG